MNIQRTSRSPPPMNIGLQRSIVSKELIRGHFEDVDVDPGAVLDLLDPRLSLPENLQLVRAEVKREDVYAEEQYEEQRITELIGRCAEDGIQACEIACRETKHDESCDKYEELQKLKALRKKYPVKGYFDIPRIKVGVRPRKRKTPVRKPVKTEEKKTKKVRRRKTKAVETVTHSQRKKLKKVATYVQSKRSKRARNIDAAKTSKDTIRLTPDNIRKWNRNPGWYDLLGIDTQGLGGVEEPIVKGKKKRAKPSLKNKAINLQKKRSNRARNIDAKKTNKDKLPVTRKNIKKWKKNPDLYDLIGVDTKGYGGVTI